MGKSKPKAGEKEPKALKGGTAPTSVSVEFEEGGFRTYEGKDALAKAQEFVSKRPSSRRIVE